MIGASNGAEWHTFHDFSCIFGGRPNFGTLSRKNSIEQERLHEIISQLLKDTSHAISSRFRWFREPGKLGQETLLTLSVRNCNQLKSSFFQL